MLAWLTAIVVASNGMLFPTTVSAQDLEVQAGGAPPELRCPVHRHRHSRAWRRHHSGVVMEMPSNEELADLPLQVETRHQDVVLQGGKYDGSRPFTMALWGDSHAASNYFSDELVRSLGLSQDQVQPTFIPATMGRMGVRLPIRKFCLSNGWKHDYDYVTRESHITATKGLGDISTHVRGSYLWVDFRAQPGVPDLRSLDILFAPPASGKRAQVGVTVDGGPEHIVTLDPDGQGVLTLKPQQLMSTLRLRLMDGSIVLQGFVPHYSKAPALYFDTFAIPGSTAHAWKVLDPDYFRQRGSEVDYDLVIMEYGTNEGNDRNFNAAKYENDLRIGLQNLRNAYPESMCVLVGPPDRGVLVQRPRRGRRHHRAVRHGHLDLLKYARIHERIGEIQRAVSRDFSCAYWSWQDAMGGPGASYGWKRRSPPLMGHDLTHLTMSGYQLSARIFAQDIGLPRIVMPPGQLEREVPSTAGGPSDADGATVIQHVPGGAPSRP